MSDETILVEDKQSEKKTIQKTVDVTYTGATRFVWEDDGMLFVGYLDKDFGGIADDGGLKDFVKKSIFVSMGYNSNVTFVLPKLHYDSSLTIKIEEEE